MIKFIIALALMLPVVGMCQDSSKLQYIPTSNFRHMKAIFTTVYSPKVYKGYVLEQENVLRVGDKLIPIWTAISYSKKRLFGRKTYKVWEIVVQGD